MSKPGKARYKLESVRASYADAVGGDRVEFEVGDGQVFTFPHPIFTPDHMQRELDSAKGDEAGARILLGDQWAAFVDAGGEANSLMLLYVAVRNEATDTVQKHRPTRG
ncbi:hypothetical protein ACIHCX_10665 [Streptomyces sp. NPDC052043]|uniref:hypothetical protein n=1 Tax=Streptomyces sp. NPDC052043 TaxID=3365684 RepID=UPI0037CFFDB9